MEKEAKLGGLLNSLKGMAPQNIEPEALLGSLLKELNQSKVRVHTSTMVEAITGFIQGATTSI